MTRRELIDRGPRKGQKTQELQELYQFTGKIDEGLKFDSGKLRYDLVPPEAMADLVRVLTYGAKKYAERNWEKGINYSRVYASLQRHLHSFWAGEDTDPESGLPHLAHATCCAMFLATYQARQMGVFDDRPVKP